MTWGVEWGGSGGDDEALEEEGKCQQMMAVLTSV